MKLPNAHLVLVGREKIIDYLLNPAHPDNGGKAQFFTSLGFHREDWEMLRAFRQLAGNDEVTQSLETAHGTKYVVEGGIETPGGKTPRVRPVWIVDRGRNCPRLVTAYPAEA